MQNHWKLILWRSCFRGSFMFRMSSSTQKLLICFDYQNTEYWNQTFVQHLLMPIKCRQLMVYEQSCIFGRWGNILLLSDINLNVISFNSMPFIIFSIFTTVIFIFSTFSNISSSARLTRTFSKTNNANEPETCLNQCLSFFPHLDGNHI